VWITFFSRKTLIG